MTPNSDALDESIVGLVRAFEASAAQGDAVLAVHPELLDARSSLGETPLHLLCLGRHAAAVRALLRHRPDVDTVSDGGSTPLADAALGGDLDTVEALLSAGARITVPGQTDLSLHSAVRSGHAATVQRLLEAGADASEHCEFGDAPLHLAAQDDAVDVIALLLRHGADRASRNRFGETPADIARTSGGQQGLALLTKAL